MLVLFLLPNVAGAFGMRFVPDEQQVGKLICYYVSDTLRVQLGAIDVKFFF